jgi:hypothetical protein
MKVTLFLKRERNRLNKVGFAVIWFVLLGLLSGFQSRLSDQEILRNFELIAFGNEYTGQQFTRVRKWSDPIRLGIQGKSTEFFESNLRQYTLTLEKITGHPISLYYSLDLQKKGKLAKNFNQKKVNVILFRLSKKEIPKAILKYFDNDRAEVDKMIKNSTCFARYFRRKNEIRGAVVIFPSHLPPDILRACIVEELAQIMGLPNDSDLVKPSIFSDSSLHRELTEHDKLLLKILYDPRITFNMKRELALEKAAEILKALR